MALVTRRRCDNCRREVEVNDPTVASWYELWRNHEALYRSEGEQERFDLCSTPCLASWANSRELVRKVGLSSDEQRWAAIVKITRDQGPLSLRRLAEAIPNESTTSIARIVAKHQAEYDVLLRSRGLAQ